MNKLVGALPVVIRDLYLAAAGAAMVLPQQKRA
jgi:hypothetical protein